ncbi:unnamed protein product [Parnassius mnemosyne]|uniref:Uncharacterized protein n=1 Tax=Parnassius mnemosyne TaxID=213953 RepID=A0AAV1LMR6_9NEOP
MSDMIINDTVPVDKKWNELIKYNIFIMKLIEFVISVILMTLPFALAEADTFHCLAAAPTLILSFIFIVLYLVDQAQDLAEQLYLFTQIFLNVVALLHLIIEPSSAGMYYGLFYCHLIIALCIDFYYVVKDKGCLIFAAVK